jgi:hypothetical protein
MAGGVAAACDVIVGAAAAGVGCIAAAEVAEAWIRTPIMTHSIEHQASFF